MNPWLALTLAIFLVALNGFYVAAEFALVKIRMSRLKQLAKEKRPFSATALWLAERMDGSLSACQLGITMASLALGWIAEPAFAFLIEPLFVAIGVEEHSTLMHVFSFLVAFSVITSLHLVIGEQAPKIYAIRNPERITLWCAVPMYWSYLLLFPFQAVLSKATNVLLGMMGLDNKDSHGQPHTEDELRALFIEAHAHGELTHNEKDLLDRVFDFDEVVCRQLMVPRGEVDIFDVNFSLSDCLSVVKKDKAHPVSGVPRFIGRSVGGRAYQGFAGSGPGRRRI